MSSSCEPKKVGPSCDDPKCAAQTMQLETKSSTTVDHTAESELARILAENVTLAPLQANPEAEDKLAKVEKLFADLETYYKSIAGRVHRAAVVLKNFLKNHFATDSSTFYMTEEYKRAMEFCNQLEGWLDSIRAFNSERTTYPGWICYRYEAKLDNLIRFEYRSFGFDHDCADTLKCMMADYISRARAAAWKEKNNRRIEITLHDAVVFLCDELVYFIEHLHNEKVKSDVPVDDSSDDPFDYSDGGSDDDSDDELDDDRLAAFRAYGWMPINLDRLRKVKTSDEDEDESEDKSKDKSKDESEGCYRIRIRSLPMKSSSDRH